MRKLDIAKKKAGFFQGRKRPDISKVTVWPLLLLLLTLIAGGAYATARGKSVGHPVGRVKTKALIGKPHKAALPLSAPTLSYPGPKTYTQGQTISLAPTSSGVAPFGYSSTVKPWGSGYSNVGALAVDQAGNVYLADQEFGIIKIPAGNGTHVQLNGYSSSIGGLAVDAAGDVFASSFEGSGGSEGATIEDIWELPAGGKPLVYLGYTDADNDYAYITADPAGTLFVVYDLDEYPNQYWSLSEVPPGSTSLQNVNTGGIPLGEELACDAAGNLFAAPGGLTEIPAGNGAPVNIATPYLQPRRFTFDAAGNLYVVNYSNGQYLLQMVPAGNLAAQPVTIGAGFSTASGVAVDGVGNVYESCYGNASQQTAVVQVNPNGGYFITPALPAGLHFNSNTGVISGVPTVASAATTYTITAYNGSGSTTATVSIAVGPGQYNADLTSLKSSNGVFSPVFSPANSNYTASVVNGVHSLQLTPVTALAGETVKINGTIVADNATSAPIPLSVGNNTISTVVTSPNGFNVKTYSLIVTRAGNSDDDLISLKRSAGLISPFFSAPITNYTTNVVNGVRSITVTPTSYDPEATIKVNGTTVTSGNSSRAIALVAGSNTIDVVVTSSDGTASKTYTLTVNRPGNSNDNLLALKRNAGVISPAFAATTTSYTTTVANNVRTITITPTASDPDAIIKVNGITVATGATSSPIALPIGSAIINTSVTSSDGTATKTYTLTVSRPPSNNDDLLSLSSTGGALSPAFAPSTTQYTATAEYKQTPITITPAVADPEATVTVNGAIVASGTASAPIDLAVGSNTIKVVVTASDKISSKTYTLTETRSPASNNADLTSSLVRVNSVSSQGNSQSTVVYSPAFSSSTTYYTATVPYAARDLDFYLVASDPYATITVNGITAISGGVLYDQLLNEGANTFNVVVTATDGVTTKTYTLIVFRRPLNSYLKGLSISQGTIYPYFSSTLNNYQDLVPTSVTSVTVTPVAYIDSAIIKVNGVVVTSGTASQPIPLPAITNNIQIEVITQSDTAAISYTTVFYNILVEHDANLVNMPDASLSVSSAIEKPTLEGNDIVVHQGISPNGDGVNDFLVIDGIQAYPDNKLSIMNRNGQLVYEAKGYDNSSKVFDGHSNKNGQMQLPGTYFYQLDYTTKGITKHKTGFIVLKY